MTGTPAPVMHRKIIQADLAGVVVVVVAAVLAISGLYSVPFHPDEATRLFTSADLEGIFTHPVDLAWTPGVPVDIHDTYRLLDAPLVNYLIGLGRFAGGYPAPQSDWNWSAGWNENAAAGAVPNPRLLAFARLLPSVLLPLSVMLIYLAFRRIDMAWTGAAAALLLVINPLILLHARHAMAEAGMIFALSLALFILTSCLHKPILAGLAAGLAFCAKQSLLVIIPFGLLAVLYSTWKKFPQTKRIVRNGVIYLVAAGAVIILLNPFLWKHPVEAIQAAWESRRELLTRQVEEMGKLAPDQIADSPLESAGFLISQAYILPPAAEDVGNYHAELAAQEDAYFSFLPHRWLRGFAGGGIFLIMGLFGFFCWPFTRGFSSGQSLFLSGLAIISLALFISLALAVPLPFQRYALPLVFFGCLWTAVGVSLLIRILRIVLAGKPQLP